MKSWILLSAVALVSVTYTGCNRQPGQQPAAQNVQPAAAPVQPAPVEPAPAAAAPAPKPAPAGAVRRPAAQTRMPEAAPAAQAPAPQPAAQTPAAQQPQQQPQPQQPPAAAPPPVQKPAPAPPPQPKRVTIAAGTLIPVRLGEQLNSDRNAAGDSFTATLDQPLVVDGFVIAERGARVEGKVIAAEKAGRVRGTSQLSIQLVRLNTADGQRVDINTRPFVKEGAKSVGKDAAKVGAAAGIGAAIGAIAGGGRGAAIGAAVGGAAGTGGVMATRGSAADLPVETRITFRLEEPVTITEKLR